MIQVMVILGRGREQDKMWEGHFLSGQMHVIFEVLAFVLGNVFMVALL